MNDWVVETPSFEEDLMNNRVVMLNQNGVNRVVEIIKEKDKEIERLTISLQAQEELTMNWYNKVKKARDLFYEKCRISQNDAYIFNEVDYEELSNILGSDKEKNVRTTNKTIL